MRLFLDIETLPADWDADTIAAKVRADVPANYKSDEAIAKWIAENGDKAHRATALDPLQGRILCIGYAFDEEPVRVAYSATGGAGALLDELYAAIRAHDGRAIARPIWVGHSIAGFDVPWIKMHALRLRHPLSDRIPFEKWGKGLDDTKEMASVTDPRNGRKLADLCRFFGIEGKGEGLDGSKVYDAWLNNEHEKISRYCAQDVAMTRDLYRVLVGAPAVLAVGGGG